MGRPLLTGAALRAALPYLAIGAGVLALFLWLGTLPAARVGDGSEYYAMFYAWTDGLRPWMTPAANAAYDALQRSGEISGLVERDWFYQAFSELRVGDTTDFNHFWLYSLLAVLCQQAAALLQIHLSSHASFLTLHALLVGGTLAAAYRYYGWRGAGVMLAMTLCSPMLWYLDKVHTEPMTVCLLLLALMQMHRERYAAAALLLALTSTQNPSFALIAGIPWAYRVLLQWRQRYSIGELALLAGAAVTVLLHPAYYFWRYHVVTPQLLAGGAKLGGELSTFYIWILDPDLGLLPNWPLGVAMLLLGALLWLRQRAGKEASLHWPEVLFISVYLLVNFYANSSTNNLNSAATPGLARYALWYMPLGFTLLLWIVQRTAWRTLAGGLTALLLLAAMGCSAWLYHPLQPERYTTPSASSLWLQTHAPGLYNPPPEVFMERYSGVGEDRAFNVVVGPDCSKLLLVRAVPGAGGVATPPRCLYDSAKLQAYQQSMLPTFDKYRYAQLTSTQARSLQQALSDAVHSTALGANGSFALGEGWSTQEAWGVWSQAQRVTMYLPCAGQPFRLSMYLHSYGKQALAVRSGDQLLFEGPVAQDGGTLQFTVPPQACRGAVAKLDLRISDPHAPSEQGNPADQRLLGIALHNFQLSRLP
ncbi:hypothetical protein GTP45_18645 [Pseudoduganella sp. FT55W]|uniref:Glycosyltransferase RgtA/B/C/D-like domain-containing protein n=1 Tax=Duganella rivi TaxID=2666083 RepID=A0A7X4GTF7_9BURK|nr:hypothetical protein [Duganella rivi]MYM68839.1 hypothetical protein [Duganella rivi]